ncbi:hypothetical protein [Lacihabitans sp. CCS-44]|uniref:hypothetical protein n=1 Tax=Lacihabitans sp. CCS-44 TaxID=2487331 RepID=UPI0020CF236B|nr:hypothetical protein [Lacihabitans sp. CCS-44]
MTSEVTINKKKFFIVPEKEFQVLQKKAALGVDQEDLFTIEDARKYSKKLINQWAKEKSE